MGAGFDKMLFQVTTLRSIANRFFLFSAQKPVTDFMTAIWVVPVLLHNRNGSIRTHSSSCRTDLKTTGARFVMAINVQAVRLRNDRLPLGRPAMVTAHQTSILWRVIVDALPGRHATVHATSYFITPSRGRSRWIA
ncbi:uncharacterized protein ARMOST_15785 [Armillaria ostoyae]|uniref:Uncharacterized protein n=1 Tax=Armillaria ostoyae TaxID=47428 RepID=A0A284RUB4_ARMOS|nr:uncharacterized protein ARMOST_15785 [Armillaria ostoyae]